MKKLLVLFLLSMCLPMFANSATEVKDDKATKATSDKVYEEVTQAALSSAKGKYINKQISITGQYLFTGSDFCYQIRKTTINTRDYLCFALGPISVVRLYLKKDSPQVEELLKMRKGKKLQAFGTYDETSGDYRYMVVDRFEVVK
jgi:hypothetical protein